jgi:hypothetical protein
LPVLNWWHYRCLKWDKFSFFKFSCFLNCSLSLFDFEKHGNKHYGSPCDAIKDVRSSQGKMEKSFLRSSLPFLIMLVVLYCCDFKCMIWSSIIPELTLWLKEKRRNQKNVSRISIFHMFIIPNIDQYYNQGRS